MFHFRQFASQGPRLAHRAAEPAVDFVLGASATDRSQVNLRFRSCCRFQRRGRLDGPRPRVVPFAIASLVSSGRASFCGLPAILAYPETGCHRCARQEHRNRPVQPEWCRGPTGRSSRKSRCARRCAVPMVCSPAAAVADRDSRGSRPGAREQGRLPPCRDASGRGPPAPRFGRPD